ncbi:MAG: glutathione S-transferase N-terminal domain-containing protein, partial [Pseudomonadota bacterium]
MILYDYVLSPSCYKVRLCAALLGVTLELRPVNFHPGQEQKSDALLALNPAGHIPILQDGDLILTESAAMLTYLAARFGPEWLAHDQPREAARVQQWLAFAHRLTSALGGARLIEMLHVEGDLTAL